MSFEIMAYLKEKNQRKEDHPPFNFNTFLHINYFSSSSSLVGLGFEQVWHSFIGSLDKAITQLCQCHLELERVKGSSYFYLGFFFFFRQKISITLQRM